MKQLSHPTAEDREDGDTRRRSVIMFDSMQDLLDHNLLKDYRSKEMEKVKKSAQHMTEAGRLKFYGAKTMAEAHKIALEGLPREGITAIKLAKNRVSEMSGEIFRTEFYDTMDTSGAYVDMGRYVEGVPECMVNFMPVEVPTEDRIVSLVLNVSYHLGISAEAIRTNGQAMLALVEAVEMTGKQTEVWTDMYVRGGSPLHYTRTAVRLKKAGEPFDVGMFMYALTHNSYLRCHIFNAMNSHPEEFKEEVGITSKGNYGMMIRTATDMDDFPPYSIYIPCISRDWQAGKFVNDVLRQLGLIEA